METNSTELERISAVKIQHVWTRYFRWLQYFYSEEYDEDDCPQNRWKTLRYFW